MLNSADIVFGLIEGGLEILDAFDNVLLKGGQVTSTDNVEAS